MEIKNVLMAILNGFSTNTLMVIFNFLLVVVTGCLVIYTRKLWTSTERLVKGAEDTAERQLRAYVTIIKGEMEMVGLAEGGLGVKVHVELNNSGQTPGYGFTTWIKEPETLESGAIPFGLPTPLDERSAASIIGAGASAHLCWTIRIDDADCEAITQGRKNIFVWGGADYVDIFGKDRHFVFRDVNGMGSIFKVPGNQLALRPHRLGYDAN